MPSPPHDNDGILTLVIPSAILAAWILTFQNLDILFMTNVTMSQPYTLDVRELGRVVCEGHVCMVTLKMLRNVVESCWWRFFFIL